jgi:D-glycero-alpha-D-manno-heptose-7-phosphate kinase
MIEAATRAGALGGKAMGASGGGCVLAIAPLDSVGAVREAMAALGQPLAVRLAPEGFRVAAAGQAEPALRRPWSSVA